MRPHEDEPGELLWKYIEKIRRTDDPADTSRNERTLKGPDEYTALLLVVDAVHDTFRNEIVELGDEHRPPAALSAAIQESSHKKTSRRQQARGAFLLPWRLALGGLAVIIAIVLLILHTAHPVPRTTVTLRVQSIIRDHEEFLQNPAKMTIKGSDPARVAAALSAQIGYWVTPVDLTLAGGKLLGGRRCTLDGHVIAFFMYRASHIPVSVYELRAPRCRLPGMAKKVVAGQPYLDGTDGKYNVLAWRMSKSLYVMVSSLDANRLVGMAQRLSRDAANGRSGETL